MIDITLPDNVFENFDKKIKFAKVYIKNYYSIQGYQCRYLDDLTYFFFLFLAKSFKKN